MDIWLLFEHCTCSDTILSLLQRIPFAVLEHSQNQCTPSLTFRVLPPQFRKVFDEASIPVSVRNLIICSSFLESIKCINLSYDIHEVFESNLYVYQGNKGWTF